MRKKNIFIIILLVVGILGILVVEGYIKPEMKRKEEKYRIEQQSPLTHDFKSISKYRNKYMGNASNLINLNNNLPALKGKRTFQLFPEKFAVEMNYDQPKSAIEEESFKQIILYNGTANFALIDNLQVLRINFTDASYTLKRDRMDSWYGEKVSGIQSEQQWKEKVQSKLKNPNYVEDFFRFIKN